MYNLKIKKMKQNKEELKKAVQAVQEIRSRIGISFAEAEKTKREEEAKMAAFKRLAGIEREMLKQIELWSKKVEESTVEEDTKKKQSTEKQSM